MPDRLRVACIQNSAENNTENSLVECAELIGQASARGAELICLPEYCSHLGVDDTGFQTGACDEGSHPAIRTFVELAQKYQRWIQVGSVAVTEGDQFRNRSLLINGQGEIVARYDNKLYFVLEGAGVVTVESERRQVDAVRLDSGLRDGGGLGQRAWFETRIARRTDLRVGRGHLRPACAAVVRRYPSMGCRQTECC